MVRRLSPSVLALLLAGAAAIALPRQGHAQVLQVATDQSPVGLDPHIATAFSTLLIDSNIYEGLTGIDATLAVVPALAQSWTVSPDGLTYTFKLRDGVVFHSGQKMTAADVVASFARVREPKTGSPYASRFTAISKIEAVGDDGVRITLSTPSAPFLAQLATLAIVPADAGATLARVPVGTGPFKFKEWVPDTDIELARNDAYWNKGQPSLAGVKFNIVPESSTRQLGLTGGTYQMLPNIDAATATALEGQPGVKLLSTQDLAYSLVGFNTSRPPFDKPEVREAFNTALDRGQIAQAAYFGKAVPGGPLSPSLKQWALPNSAFPCYTPDPAKSKALLQTAGLTLPVHVTLNVLGSLQQVVDVAQVVQAQANKAGFDVQLNVQEQGKFIQDWRGSNFEGFVSLNSGATEPDGSLGRSFETGGATNVYKYSDKDLDALLAKGRATANDADRKPIYDAAQKILACSGPAAFLDYGTLFTAVRANVTGYQMMPTRATTYLSETKIGQ